MRYYTGSAKIASVRGRGRMGSREHNNHVVSKHGGGRVRFR